MTSTIARSVLLPALKAAAAAVDSRPTNPILGMVHLAFTATSLSVSAQSQGARLTIAVAAESDGECEYCVDPVSLLALVMKAGGLNVTMTPDHDKGRVLAVCGNARYNLNISPTTEYPSAAEVDSESTIIMPVSALASVLSRVAVTIAPDDNRYGLAGAHMEQNGGMLRLVSTDGNRLTYDEAPATITGEIPRRMLIPGASVKLILPMLATTGDVTLVIGSRSARVTVGSSVLTLRLMEADFPDYRQVIPKEHSRVVRLLRDELSAAVQAVAPMATDASHTMSMAFTGEGITLKARKLDSGDATTTCGADLTGDPLTMGVNANFVLQAMAVAPGDRVVWKMGGVVSPIVMNVEDAPAVWVLMPVRLD